MSVVDWLLDADPSIRWQVMRDLTDAPAAVVAAERARVAAEGRGARLLALQAADGRWGGAAWARFAFPTWWHYDVLRGLEYLRDVGVQARLMSQALRKLTGAISRSRAVVVFINQLRDKIGVMYGSPETTTGGKALKFYASIRLDIRKVETLKQGNDIVGMRAKVKVVKNKVAPPFRIAEFDIMFNEDGVISRSGALVDAGLEQGHVKKSGAWFQYEETRLGQGRENAKQFLREHPEVAAELEERIRRHGKPTVVVGGADDDEGPEL